MWYMSNSGFYFSLQRCVLHADKYFCRHAEGCTRDVDFSLVLFGLLMKPVVVVMESPSNHIGM